MVQLGPSLDAVYLEGARARTLSLCHLPLSWSRRVAGRLDAASKGDVISEHTRTRHATD